MTDTVTRRAADAEVWETGETDLQTARISEESGVNKHYDLEDTAQLDVVLSELIGLIRDGTLPPDVLTARVMVRASGTDEPVSS
jgi:hypothetical protein